MTTIRRHRQGRPVTTRAARGRPRSCRSSARPNRARDRSAGPQAPFGGGDRRRPQRDRPTVASAPAPPTRPPSPPRRTANRSRRSTTVMTEERWRNRARSLRRLRFHAGIGHCPAWNRRRAVVCDTPCCSAPARGPGHQGGWSERAHVLPMHSADRREAAWARPGPWPGVPSPSPPERDRGMPCSEGARGGQWDVRTPTGWSLGTLRGRAADQGSAEVLPGCDGVSNTTSPSCHSGSAASSLRSCR